MTRKTSPVRIRPAPDYVIYGGSWDGNSDPEVDPRLPRPAKRFWNALGLGTATHGFAAYADGKIVGFIRVYKENDDGILPPFFNAAGTWVAASYRRRGIAERLWAAALREDPTFRDIHVTICTRSGARLLDKLIKTHGAPYRWRPDFGAQFPEGTF